MTTENEVIEVTPTLIPIERDIKDLLDMKTYQGMSDAEIEKIISYHMERAIKDSENLARINAIMIKSEQELENSRDVAAHSKAILEKMLNVTAERTANGYEVSVPAQVKLERVEMPAKLELESV